MTLDELDPMAFKLLVQLRTKLQKKYPLLEEAWNAIDLDHSGVVTAGEFRAMLVKDLHWDTSKKSVPFFFPPKQSETIVGGSYYVAPATIKPLYRVHENGRIFVFFLSTVNR